MASDSCLRLMCRTSDLGGHFSHAPLSTTPLAHLALAHLPSVQPTKLPDTFLSCGPFDLLPMFCGWPVAWRRMGRRAWDSHLQPMSAHYSFVVVVVQGSEIWPYHPPLFHHSSPAPRLSHQRYPFFFPPSLAPRLKPHRPSLDRSVRDMGCSLSARGGRLTNKYSYPCPGTTE